MLAIQTTGKETLIKGLTSRIMAICMLTIIVFVTISSIFRSSE